MEQDINPSICPGSGGPPSELEMRTLYPALFTFAELKEAVAAGDLGLLRRHPALQKRYDLWCEKLKSEHGSLTNYLVNFRLGWGPTQSRPETPSSHAQPTFSPTLQLPTPPPTRPFTPLPQHQSQPHFTQNIPEHLIKIVPNDWPYSVPPEVSHLLIWSRLPIIHSSVIPERIWKRVEADGLMGFTGTDDIPQRKIPSIYAPDEDELVKQTGNEVHQFVKNRWPEDKWECAWFVNPPRLQSIPGLAHIHVFARKK